MYGKASWLEKHIGTKLAWLQEKYSHHTHESIGCSSSQANCYLTEKELHQLRMDEEALRRRWKKEAMNKKGTRAARESCNSSRLKLFCLDAGLPSEKVVVSGKNGNDGDLLLFRDGPVGLSSLLGMMPVAASLIWGFCQARCWRSD
ncbi:hypothetical protein Tco_0778181 [Tanacetum coccineum]